MSWQGPELLVLRHGETEWNAAGRLQGGLDSPLTPRGQAQARAMGAHLAARGVTAATHRLVASPQGRARATAGLVMPGASALLDDRLREIGMGEWSGLTMDEIARRWPATRGLDLVAFYAAIPGGERFDDLWARVRGVLDAITGPTVLVTHGITARFLCAAALGQGPAGLASFPGGQGVIHRLGPEGHEVLVPPDPV